MVKAAVYDEFEDVGLVVQEEVLEAWTLVGAATERLDTLVQRGRWLTRRGQMGLEQSATAAEALKHVRSRATWMVRVAGVDGMDWGAAVAPPAPDTAEGKKLSKAILDRPLADWCEGWLADADDAMRYFVTVGRRAATVQGWSRPEKSMGNKLANCFYQERESAIKVVQLCKSISTGTG